ncbi:hypothetical protein D3C75_735620 [compost metagenome]
METELCTPFFVHFDNIAAFWAGLFDTSPLDIARIDDHRILVQNAAFMDMAERPIIKSASDQIFAAARRIGFMLQITIHISVQ